MGVMLVTGASRGIGAAIAVTAAKAGWDVAVCCRQSTERAQQVVAAIRDLGRKAVCIQADVAEESEIVAMFKTVDRELGPIGALVNNAAIDHGASILESDSAQLQRIVMTNLMGPWICAREAVRRMAASQGGSGGVIVNISSVSAKTGGLPRDVMYAATKGGLDSFTLGLAREVGRDGIRVVGVRPGLTRTEMFKSERSLKAADEIARRDTALGRMAEPEDVAEVVVWLCSEQARYVTCTNYDVSGGR